MTFDEAIGILAAEHHHIRHHLLEEGKAPEYYTELGQLAEAMQMGITALKTVSRMLNKQPWESAESRYEYE